MKVSVLLLAFVGAVVSMQRACAASAAVSYTIQTVAGSSEVGDGGPALNAAISDAEGVAIDSAGNIFLADANDHRVRKVTSDGMISTVAGDGSPGFRGDGGPATASRLRTPYGIAVDSAGNLYIADLGNNRIRKVATDGAISTVPGTDSLLAPRNVALDSAGSLYISEFKAIACSICGRMVFSKSSRAQVLPGLRGMADRPKLHCFPPPRVSRSILPAICTSPTAATAASGKSPEA